MAADVDPLLVGLPLSAPVTVTVYDPAGAEAGAVTCRVVDPVAPGLTVRLLARLAIQADGTPAVRLKLEALHAELS